MATVTIVRGQPPGGGPPIPGQVEYETAQASDLITTTSTDFVDMPGMSVTFTSDINNQAVAMFSAKIPTLGTGGCGSLIRLVVDGTPLPDEIFIARSDEPSNRNYNFVTQSLSPGSHIAKIEWKFNPYNADSNVTCVQNRSLVVLHK